MKQNRWTIKYRSPTYIYLIRSIYVSHWSILPNMMFIHQIILTILSKITRPWNIGHVDLYLLWGQSWDHTVSLSENITLMHQIVLGDIRQNHWTMKYRSHRPTFILRSNVGTCWPIIPKNDVHTSKSLQDIMQNHWTMKYRSQWPSFIFRSNVESYWIIIPNNDVHISNSLQDTRQNHWSIKWNLALSMTYLIPRNLKYKQIYWSKYLQSVEKI